ncbi:hypothetical protein T4B_8892 [Trichinella pseudospiralis]|uniref:Uncharacterized protein n=1 Tax=Trichinella pseudospiralis TaxID=6337 RepID=A0A0V1IED4_TRIPS|nr:hypothetical protein T4B_8892 [Trichinella pseudospiralis]
MHVMETSSLKMNRNLLFPGKQLGIKKANPIIVIVEENGGVIAADGRVHTQFRHLLISLTLNKSTTCAVL